MKGSNNSFFGKTHSEESKLKMGETKRKNGFKPWNTGIEMPDEIKLSISKAKENYKWWTNGKEEIQSDICPNGWNPGRTLKFSHSDEYKEYMKKLYSNGKMNWWNNGIINKRQKEKPIGDEWVRGRLFSKDLYDKFCKNKGS